MLPYNWMDSVKRVIDPSFGTVSANPQQHIDIRHFPLVHDHISDHITQTLLVEAGADIS